ncbi:Sodium channel protein 60E (Drosophila ion channel 60) (Drosophila sodium channel 1) (Protein smell-impaired 60E) (Sodium channel 2) (DmNav2) [Durusdinium trenchii]|uniref:Sodium channel protein 60E (Drosophila ion channel 60) (Drosophila sodium channel 1) (Protein smell-impaired 60E) (Sodium channel 2) (DmNav2) n=1 Tax=Durusdinium trenchii TaxID=1381693 RepID=A0ABP0QFG2_9DINO
MVVFATLANTVLIGLESDYSRGIQLADRLPWFICEVLFTTFFFVEMLLRINQLNWEYFVDPWNVFDYCLVVFSVADLVVSLAKTDGSGLRWAASLRVFRSLRIARAIRREKVVRGLFRITQGFIDALPSMLWTFLAAVLFAYMLAIVLTALVGSDLAARELWENAEVYCGTVTRSNGTALSGMLRYGNRFPEESRATAVAKSERLLMTAMLEEFTDAWTWTGLAYQPTTTEEYDQDYNGELDFWEFRKVLRTPGMTKKLSFLGVGPDEAESLFELMDVDKSGSLTPIEFLTGLFKVKGPAKGQDLCRLITLAEKNKRMATKWVTRVRHLNAKADEIQVRLNGVCEPSLDGKQSTVPLFHTVPKSL